MISVVFGYPIETRETINETFNMCLKAKVYPSIDTTPELQPECMITH